MQGKFDYFVLFAEMRTGSNLLEESLNAFPDLHCYGEAFNPTFVGYPKKPDLLGVTMAMRDADPARLIATMQKRTTGLPGFRYFHDHDPRVPDLCLPDPRCAKVILTRNPLDSYVSWKIAQATDQWKLTNARKHQAAQITFDKAEFQAQLSALQAFQLKLLHALQSTGQTAFYIGYDDLHDVDVLNGLARFLGSDAQLEQFSTGMIRQNPGSLRDKVKNYDQMVADLADIDFFNLSRTPNAEPRRGPAVPSYVAAAEAPLLYLPLRAGPEAEIRNWLAAVDGVDDTALLGEFTQKTLRQWKRRHPGHRSFTVLRHPVARAHAAFCDHILPPDGYAEIRETLRSQYDLPIPAGAPGPDYDRRSHRQAFLAFLGFVKKNLSGQTGIRVDPAWASQEHVLAGFARFAPPDMVLREDQLALGLSQLAAQAGLDTPPPAPEIGPQSPIALDDIYDEEVEAAVRAVYQRDYMLFGFGRWDAA